MLVIIIAYMAFLSQQILSIKRSQHINDDELFILKSEVKISQDQVKDMTPEYLKNLIAQDFIEKIIEDDLLRISVMPPSDPLNVSEYYIYHSEIQIFIKG